MARGCCLVCCIVNRVSRRTACSDKASQTKTNEVMYRYYSSSKNSSCILGHKMQQQCSTVTNNKQTTTTQMPQTTFHSCLRALGADLEIISCSSGSGFHGEISVRSQPCIEAALFNDQWTRVSRGKFVSKAPYEIPTNVLTGLPQQLT